jgi:hypothetical protein
MEKSMSPHFYRLLSQQVGIAFAQQLAFADWLGDRPWNLDLQRGTVEFGADLAYPVQLLGTEAEAAGTWLWAWANTQSKLPEHLLQASYHLRDLGFRDQIPELSDRSFSLEIATGHELSLVATGLSHLCCYYRGPYDGGALFFLVFDLPPQLWQPATPERLVSTLTQVIAQFTVDHRLMAEELLRSQGFHLTPNSTQLIATRNSHRIALTFDLQHRLTSIESS